ncbi:MAG: hypothetical protein AAF205_05755, partial [Pseudomonadota bacterium]
KTIIFSGDFFQFGPVKGVSLVASLAPYLEKLTQLCLFHCIIPPAQSEHTPGDAFRLQDNLRCKISLWVGAAITEMTAR